MMHDAKKKRIIISNNIIFDKKKIGYHLLKYTTINKEDVFLFKIINNIPYQHISKNDIQNYQ